MKIIFIVMGLMLHSPFAFSWGRLGHKKHSLEQKYEKPSKVLEKVGDSLLLEFSENTNEIRSLIITGRTFIPDSLRRGLIGHQELSFDLLVNDQKWEGITIRTNRNSSLFRKEIQLKKPLSKSEINKVSLALANDARFEVYEVNLQ